MEVRDDEPCCAVKAECILFGRLQFYGVAAEVDAQPCGRCACRVVYGLYGKIAIVQVNFKVMVFQDFPNGADEAVVMCVVAFPLSVVVPAYDTLMDCDSIVVTKVHGRKEVFALGFLTVERNTVVVTRVTCAADECLSPSMADGVCTYSTDK